LPDATLVTLSKTNRTASLGVLRSEHQLRMQRFAAAAGLGKQRALLQKPLTGPAIIAGTTHGGTLVPMNFSLSNFPEFSPWSHVLPADYLAFCQAAAVTACLYIPGGGSGMLCGPAGCLDEDPLITDSQLCASEGGTFESVDGCFYAYPAQYFLNFNPGPPTAQGYNVTQSANCPSPWTVTVDPHGAVKLTGPASGGGVSCLVSVFVP